MGTANAGSRYRHVQQPARGHRPADRAASAAGETGFLAAGADRASRRMAMTDEDTSSESIELPSWAQVSKKRRKHIVRVTWLLALWADEMRLAPADRQAWLDAGRFHDALRDARVDELRELAGSSIAEVELLHGPAAAARLARDGESRQ